MGEEPGRRLAISPPSHLLTYPSPSQNEEDFTLRPQTHTENCSPKAVCSRSLRKSSPVCTSCRHASWAKGREGREADGSSCKLVHSQLQPASQSLPRGPAARGQPSTAAVLHPPHTNAFHPLSPLEIVVLISHSPCRDMFILLLLAFF